MTIEEFIEGYIYRLLVLAVVLVAAIGGYLTYQHSRRRGRHSALDYIFVWPLLLGRKTKDGRTEMRDFSKRELFGWVIVILLGIVAVTFGL